MCLLVRRMHCSLPTQAGLLRDCANNFAATHLFGSLQVAQQHDPELEPIAEMLRDMIAEENKPGKRVVSIVGMPCGRLLDAAKTSAKLVVNQQHPYIMYVFLLPGMCFTLVLLCAFVVCVLARNSSPSFLFVTLHLFNVLAGNLNDRNGDWPVIMSSPLAVSRAWQTPELSSILMK